MVVERVKNVFAGFRYHYNFCVLPRTGEVAKSCAPVENTTEIGDYFVIAVLKCAVTYSIDAGSASAWKSFYCFPDFP